MACSVCFRDIRIAAKGLCGACYQRQQKRGTTDYAPQRVRGLCGFKGCDRPHVARGYCQLHYERWAATGSPENTKRPDWWGSKTKHPLYHSWSYLMRYRATHPVVEEWTDFLQFVTDVGQRPEAKAKLFAGDDTQPIGPDNFVWKHSITQRVAGEDDATYRKRRDKVYRHVRSELHAKWVDKKSYGLDGKRKAGILKAQGGMCAICFKHEDELTGRFKRLAVDHCHTSGEVRGLLCSNCNTALGLFKDDIKRLRQAIHYLTETRNVS